VTTGTIEAPYDFSRTIGACKNFLTPTAWIVIKCTHDSPKTGGTPPKLFGGDPKLTVALGPVSVRGKTFGARAFSRDAVPRRPQACRLFLRRARCSGLLAKGDRRAHTQG
jgi:hypothetical protein